MDDGLSAYQEALKQAPLDDLIITNLIILGDRPAQHFNAFYDGVQSYIAGDQSQYYLVMAVMSALETNKKLPFSWGEQAERRFHRMLQEEPFRDEVSRLTRALYHWFKKRGDNQKSTEYAKYLPGGRLNPSLYLWPGKNWIPD